MVEVISIPGLGYECNSYLIMDDKIVLIDTGTGATNKLPDKVRGYTKNVDLIINTHAHLDHVGGNSFFLSDVAIHGKDVKALETGDLYGTGELFGMKATSGVNQILNDGDIIETGEMSLSVVHTPGHTPGSTCLLSSMGHLFSGDTLFSGGSFGRTDLPGGSTAELLNSLERLKSEAFDFLMPGHIECVKDGKKHLEAALCLLGDVYERI
jgi:glyoxylase-like metal-dependent hydrolase (beta-lactamase superfamily II)